MRSDPVQDFLISLYNYRFILALVIAVSALNGLATLLKSFGTITTSINHALTWSNDHLFPKKKLCRDTLKLVGEIELSVSAARDKTPSLNVRQGILEGVLANSPFPNALRASYKETFLRRVEFVRNRFAEYGLTNSDLDYSYLNPEFPRDILRICSKLREFATTLSPEKPKRKSR